MTYANGGTTMAHTTSTTSTPEELRAAIVEYIQPHAPAMANSMLRLLAEGTLKANTVEAVQRVGATMAQIQAVLRS
jgi:hypothetical protein